MKLKAMIFVLLSITCMQVLASDSVTEISFTETIKGRSFLDKTSDGGSDKIESVIASLTNRLMKLTDEDGLPLVKNPNFIKSYSCVTPASFLVERNGESKLEDGFDTDVYVTYNSKGTFRPKNCSSFVASFPF